MTQASDYRGSLGAIAARLYEDYGVDANMPGIVPWPVSEAVMSIESDGDNLPRNDAGAIGVMQVVTSGREAGYFAQLTGDTPTDEKLTNPDYNMAVAIAGLAQDKKDVEGLGYPGWQYATQYYFGGFLNGQPNDGAVDDFGTTGKAYRDNTELYIRQLPGYGGDTIWGYLKNGGWFTKENETPNPEVNNALLAVRYQTNTIDLSFSGAKEAYNTVKTTEEKIASIYDVMTSPSSLARVGLVIVGISVLTVGLIAVAW